MKILTIFSSIGGNTELVVSYIGELCREKGLEFDSKRVELVDPVEIADYNLVILASPTYNQGTLENHFYPFLKTWKEDYKGSQKFAVIGLGSKDYYPEYLTESAQILKDEVEARNGIVVGQPLRITGNPLKVMDKLVPRWLDKVISEV
jgi:flavodoxin